MPGRVIEEHWDLTSNDYVAMPNTTVYREDGALKGSWSDIWRYQVPVGQAHILKSEHRFSLYAEEVAPNVECTNPCRVRILIRDQSAMDEKTIYGPALYIMSTEFRNRDLMAHLDLQADLAVEERFWIVISMNTIADEVDVSGSYFNLETIRVRSTI